MDDLALAFEAAMTGRHCRVERRETDWSFDFQDNAGFGVGCHWRLVSPDGIALTDEDDGQQFGLPQPVDAENKANALLAGASVTSAELDKVTADICIRFSNGLRLDVVSNSMGYESWQGSFVHAGKPTSIVALGGGGLAFF